MSCCSKYRLSEVEVKGPLVDLGRWIKLPEVPVNATVDRSGQQTIVVSILMLTAAAIAVVLVAKK